MSTTRGHSHMSTWSRASVILSAGAADAPSRALTATPESIHSLAPSVHFTAPPQSAHLRMHSHPHSPARAQTMPDRDDAPRADDAASHRRQSSLPLSLRSAGPLGQGVGTPTSERNPMQYAQWRQLVISAAISTR